MHSEMNIQLLVCRGPDVEIELVDFVDQLSSFKLIKIKSIHSNPRITVVYSIPLNKPAMVRTPQYSTSIESDYTF